MRSKVAYMMAIATTLLTSSLPAYANPNTSWINSNTLATDHRAYCDDIVAQNVTSREESRRQNDNGSQRQSSDDQQSSRDFRSDTTQIGGSFMRIGGNYSRNSTREQEENSRDRDNSRSQFNRDSQHSSSHNTVTSITAGQNCSTFVESAANRDIAITNANAQRDVAITQSNTQRDIAGINANAEITINRDQQETMRMGIETQRELGLEQIQSQQQMFMMDRFLPNYNQFLPGQ